MTRRALVLLLLTIALPACFGKHRPPALTNTPGGDPRSSSDPSSRSREPQSVDSGPDVRRLSDDSASAENFNVSDPSGEGGPLADVLFEYDRATLSDEARATLEKHALWLQSHRAAQVVVEGHCDERGTTDYNLALGEQRARAAMEYLVSLGVAQTRLRTVSYGKERPLDRSGSEAAFAKNRRAHLSVSR